MGDDDELLTAQQEWEAVPTVTVSKENPEFAGNGDQGERVKDIVSPLISANDAVLHFRDHPSLSFYKHNIKPIIQYTGLQSCIRKLFGPPLLRGDLEDDRDFIFAIASWSFENEDLVHIQMLHTIYKQLTSSNIDPPRFGDHWDAIGFQGTDPATDLRGGGCLGLVNLVYLSNSVRLKKLSQSIFTLSRHSTQNFPFCVMSLNMTRIALQALREQLLNKLANDTGDILTVFNEFYVACFLHLYLLWREGNKTIHHSGYVVQETDKYCCKHVSLVVQRLEAYLQLSSRTSISDSGTTCDFTNIDKEMGGSS